MNFKNDNDAKQIIRNVVLELGRCPARGGKHCTYFVFRIIFTFMKTFVFSERTMNRVRPMVEKDYMPLMPRVAEPAMVRPHATAAQCPSWTRPACRPQT